MNSLNRWKLGRIVCLILLFMIPFKADCKGAETTDDVSLLNVYFYRILNRADTISPGKDYSHNFRPVSKREALSVLRTPFISGAIRDRANRYIDLESLDNTQETFTIDPIKELHMQGIYTQERETALHSHFGSEMDGYTYTSLIAGGSASFRDLALISYDLRVSDDADTDTVDLLRYRLKTGFEHVSISLAKENVVLGPGYFGQLLSSQNVQPENSIIIKTEVPYDWGWLGAFRWYLWHTWYDDNDRDNKDPRLLGARVSLSPWDIMEIGFNRTALYGGSKDPSYDNIEAYWDLFTAANENDNNNPYNSQQAASLDISLFLPFLSDHTPFAGGKVYLEYAFSDIRAFWQPEDRHDTSSLQPLKVSYLAGLMLTTGETDITLEYVQTNRSAYSGGGGGFESGYADNGYIIGHFIGNRATGIIGEIYHEYSETVHAYIGYGYLERRNNLTQQTENRAFGGGRYFVNHAFSINLELTHARYDKTETDPSPVTNTFEDEDYSNSILEVNLEYHF